MTQKWNGNEIIKGACATTISKVLNIQKLEDKKIIVNELKKLVEKNQKNAETALAYAISLANFSNAQPLEERESTIVELGQWTEKWSANGIFVDGWRKSVINFIDWIDLWDHSIDSHFSPDFLRKFWKVIIL